MTTTNLTKIQERLNQAFARAATDASAVSVAYEDLALTLHLFVQNNEYDETPAGYLSAAEELRDHAFPNWPLAGIKYDSSCLPKYEERPRSIARGLGIYLSVALEESTNLVKLGVERIDAFLEESGLLASDVRE
jgi:hypothetical protein